MADIVKIVEKNILDLSLISKGDKILVAFSGGPDSTALLYSLVRLSKRFDFTLAACYLNHKIRLRAVRKEIEFCRGFCAKLKVPFSVIEADVPAAAGAHKISVEDAGHRFRKESLAWMAKEFDCNKIALGHHLDDLVETVLFRLIRGTGPQGLDPIKPIENGKIRPLYNIPRREIEAYLKRSKIPFMVDISNLQSKYSRNYLRNKILPLVEKHFGPKYRTSIYNFTRILSDENRFLDSFAGELAKKICSITPGGKIIVDLTGISAYDVWLKRRLIKHLLEWASGHPGMGSFEDVNRILELLDGKIKALNLTDGITAVNERNRLILYSRKINIENTPLDTKGITKLGGVNRKIKCSNVPASKVSLKRQKGGQKIVVDFDSLSQPLYVRGMKPGDSFTPLGMKQTKKLGDFLTDKKVLRNIRDEIPVVFDQKGVVWLVGYQISDRVKINKSTTRVLAIESIDNEIAPITQI
ncbi:MAG: tRNA lysidine(34) synthetase TilS [Candidatus Zixiibacteriota bacterium]